MVTAVILNNKTDQWMQINMITTGVSGLLSVCREWICAICTLSDVYTSLFAAFRRDSESQCPLLVINISATLPEERRA